MNANRPAKCRILAADIGGTNARFAAVKIVAHGHSVCGPVFHLETPGGASSFNDFWQQFLDSAPDSLAQTDAFDAIALAVAGAVHGHSATLTNIPWNISPEDTRHFGQLFLLNDFLAQAYACTNQDVIKSMQVVRAGEDDISGPVAIVGAGTGLGHAAIHSLAGNSMNRWLVSGSESGHGSFSFQGEEEKRIEQHLLKITGKSWLSNDDVVSGGGAVLLHEALTGQHTSPADALDASNETTVHTFAQFYARACRNYCLSILPVKQLIISGGIAAKNPHIIQSSAFSHTFNDAQDYQPIMERIPILLNLDDSLGVIGSAVYAWERLQV